MLVRSRERALASERRAGSWLHRMAVEQQYEIVREYRWRLLAFIGLGAALLPGMFLLLGGFARGAYVGLLTSSFAWACYLVVWQLAGVGHLQQGELGEQWTVQVLRPLLRRGEWRLINHVLLKRWDIDHVLFGPGGIVVVETKGGRTDWSDQQVEQRIRDAARQAANNARDIARYLKHEINGAPTHAVVALWPSPKSFSSRMIDGVTVLAGTDLGPWVESLPPDVLGTDGIADAWEKIALRAEEMDNHDVVQHGPPPRRFEDVVWDVCQFVVGGTLGFMAVPALATRVNFSLATAGAGALLLGAMIGLRRVPKLRPFFSGFFGTLAGFVIAVACVVLLQTIL